MGNIKKELAKARAKKVTGSIIGDFLEAIYVSMQALGSLNVSRFSIYSSLRGEAYKGWSDSAFSKKMSEAVRGGYLNLDNKSNSIEFTDKAKLRILDRITKNCEEDGKYRFLSFDIPETMRRQRDAFRRDIKKMGFMRIQKSLWVCNRNVGDLVEIACRKHKVGKYVAYILSEKSDIDGYIKNILIR
jgi:CRISPR-associated endonuclease Cas2